MNDDDKLVRFLTYLALNSDLDTKRISNKTNLGGAFVKLINHYINNDKTLLKEDGSIIALIKLYNSILTNFGKDVDDLRNNSYAQDKFMAHGLTHYNPENFLFVKQYLKDFQEYFTNVGYKKEDTSDLNRVRFSEDYIYFLQNIYLRSFEFLEYYQNILNKGKDKDKVFYEFQQTLNEIMKYVSTYYNIDQDSEYKNPTVKRITGLCVDLLADEYISKYFDTAKPFWDVLYNIFKKDEDNMIIGK
jgi:hypothetical protein